MSIDLKIVTHGLIAIVASPDDKRLTAFLCEAPLDVIPDQVAYVRFPLKNYPRDKNRRTPVVPPDDIARGRGHVVLGGERLSIEANIAREDGALSIFRDKDPASKDPTDKDRTSLFWLPKTECLAAGHGDLKPGYFADVLNVRPRLIARVDFTQGRVSTRGAEKTKVLFKSLKSKKEAHLAIARELVLELSIMDDHFVLRSDPLEGQHDAANDLRFEGSGKVEIVIGNQPEGDIYQNTPPILPLDVIGKAAAAEGSFYFNLCDKLPEDPMLPHVGSRPGIRAFCYHQEYTPTEAVNDASNIADEAPTTSAAAKPPAWSVYAYIAVDNDLSDYGRLDLTDMARANPAEVSVVAQLDVPNASTERLVLGRAGFERTPKQPGRNENSGDPDTLTNFLLAAKELRPGERMAVFMLSHATGLLDYSFDEELFVGADEEAAALKKVIDRLWEKLGKSSIDRRRLAVIVNRMLAIGLDFSSRDSLDNEDLETGLRNALAPNERFAIIGLDACFMSLIEIAYQLREAGEYLVASQDDVAPKGWPYETILDLLKNTTSAREAAIGIVEAYAAATTDARATLAAVDLDAVLPLATAMDDLGKVLLNAIPQHIDAIRKSREATRIFLSYDYIDLRGFVAALNEYLGGALTVRDEQEALAAKASAVLAAIEKAVVKTNETAAEPRAHGLAVYLPNGRVAPEYLELKMSQDQENWREFVVRYGAA